MWIFGSDLTLKIIMSLIVFGSINMDLITQTARLPLPGETLQGHHFFIVPGGKGANQAVAAARLKTKTYMIGRVGDDQLGQELLVSLTKSNVQIDSVTISPQTSSGVALITVSHTGENTIIVIPGANGQVGSLEVQQLINILPDVSTVLLQLEIPMATIITAAEIAHQAGIIVVLDPAPAPELFPEELYSLIDIITPNETEAHRLVGFEMIDEQAWEKAGQILIEKGVKTVVIKLGSRGVFYMNQSEKVWIEPFKVKVVDTVAAGDAFNGAMAAALDRGLPIQESMIWGAAAGALATTKSGAQPSLPDWETFKEFLKKCS
ncbi:MAG: ribokinase [Microcoleaceae cyanobacterium]